MTTSGTLSKNIQELNELLSQIGGLAGPVDQLGAAMTKCWTAGGKVLIAGNGGSAADAMHFAEELLVRFKKNRKALAAIALCDPTVLTCTGNDFGYDEVFARQVEGLGRAGDVLIVMSTTGNSLNLLRAVTQAKSASLVTAAFIGNGGGRLAGQCDIELLVPPAATHHTQEVHKVVYHALCEWIDTQYP